jgi:hypothetical protein
MILTFMTPKGNPSFSSGRPTPIPPESGSEFEKRMRELRLTPDTCETSHELRRWCEENRNRCFIPEALLKAWGILVDLDA